MSLRLVSFLPFVLLLSSKASAFSGSFSADYNKGFEPGDPRIGLSLGMGEELSKSFSLSLNQDVTKNIIIDSENDEYVFSDTRLGLSYKLPNMRKDFTGSLGFSLTLPVSDYSRHVEIYSKPQLSFHSAYVGIEGLSVSFGANIRDTISAYETAPAENGEGGQVLEDYRYGVSHGTSLDLYGFGMGYDVSYVETVYHKQERSASEVRDFRTNLPSQGYSISVYGSRELWTNASLSVSFNQGSALVQEGYEDYVLFDSAESSYSIGFSQSF